MKIKKQNIHLLIILFVMWLASTILLLFIGYCITGAIPVMIEKKSYFERILIVSSSPFNGYFNEYTPIGMILGFILGEVIYGIVIYFIYKKKNEKSEDVNLINTYLGENELDPDLDFIFLDNACKNGSVNEIKKEQEFIQDLYTEEPESELMIQEQFFLELFSNGYSMKQINEMMELTKYIKNLDVILLKKIFKPTMSPEDIRRHIESFYG